MTFEVGEIVKVRGPIRPPSLVPNQVKAVVVEIHDRRLSRPNQALLSVRFVRGDGRIHHYWTHELELVSALEQLAEAAE